MKLHTGKVGNAETALPLFLLYSPFSDLQDKKLKRSGKRTGRLSFLKTNYGGLSSVTVTYAESNSHIPLIVPAGHIQDQILLATTALPCSTWLCTENTPFA